jgi:phage terminase large subunit GpA-like protein
METIDRMAANALRSLVPPQRVPLDEWIESNIRLPQSASSIPGKVELWPYQREIAQAISDPSVRRISIVKPIQVGFSFLLTATVGNFVANDPCPVLFVLPTADDCRDFAVMGLDPLFRESPVLRGLLSESADEEGRNTILVRSFPGGSLRIVPAKSPRSLRRYSIKALLLDEVDAYTPTSEGSAVELAINRTTNFSNRKIILGSTPTVKSTSNILRSYNESDMGIFVVKCPACFEDFQLLWKNIEWPEKKPEDAYCRCPLCREPLQERHKAQMVMNGHYHIQKPEITKHRGFHLNSLVSVMPNMAWGELAEKFLQAKKSPDTLQTFTNCTWAEGWDDSQDQLDETAILKRAEDFSLTNIPREVMAITVGTDTQRDRLESTVLGHSREGTTYVLAHFVIWGAPDNDTTWRELDALHNTTWQHPDGGKLKVDAGCIDASDGVTMDFVISYTKYRFNRRLVAIKGVAGDRPAITMSKTAKGERLGIVGVEGLKGRLLNALSQGQTIRFSNTLTPSWFEQLLSERRVIRYSHGFPTRTFERKAGIAAEGLDSYIYAQAARALLNLDFVAREAELKQEVLPNTGMRAGTVYESSWLAQGR